MQTGPLWFSIPLFCLYHQCVEQGIHLEKGKNITYPERSSIELEQSKG